MKREYDGSYYKCQLLKVIQLEHQEIHTKYAKEIKRYGEYTKEVKELFSSREKYMIAVSEIVFSITNTLDELKHIPIYFKYFPNYKSYPKNRIYRDDYMKYHLKNYYIRINTIQDQLSLLVNEIYELGLPTRKCNVEAIIENRNTKNTETIKLLKEFKKAIQGITRLRNLIVHEGYFSDKKIFNLGTMIFLSERYEDSDYEIDIKWLSREIVKEKMEQFEKNNKVLVLMVVKIYDEIFKEYHSRHKQGDL